MVAGFAGTGWQKSMDYAMPAYCTHPCAHYAKLETTIWVGRLLGAVHASTTLLAQVPMIIPL